MGAGILSMRGGTRELRRPALFSPQSSGKLARHFARVSQISRVKRNGGNAWMPAAAVLFRERSEVLIGRRLVPWIGAQRNFRTHRRSAHAHGIDAFGMQQVRNEFVVTLEIQITDVEENHPVARLDA